MRRFTTESDVRNAAASGTSFETAGNAQQAQALAAYYLEARQT
jgi:hypothetical protein